MKAARLHAYHDPLALDEVDEPRATGPLEVVVRIGAAGLCRTDLHIQEGQWAEKSGVTLPYTLGHENAGWIHEVGSGVTNVEVGDTVIVHPFITCGLCRACRRGDDMHCVNGRFPGINQDGGFADFLLTSARSVIKLDPTLEPAGEGGADHTVRVDGSHVDTVGELTEGVGAEAILDFVGEKGAVEDGIAMVQDGGFYYVIGYGQNLTIPTIDIISREISFIGNLVGTYTDLEELMTLTAQGKVQLRTSRYPLNAINDAMADLEEGRLQGRGILVPAGND